MTKQLASINERNLALGEKSKFQLVLVCYDGSEAGNTNYILSKKLNFPGIKFKEMQGLADLIGTGNTGFIPQIVVLKADGELVTNDEGEAVELLNKLAPQS